MPRTRASRSRLTIPPLGKPAGWRPRPRFTGRCLAECAVLLVLVTVAVQASVEVVRNGPRVFLVWAAIPQVPALLVLPIVVLGSVLLLRRIRRQLSVRFDRFGVHFRRRVEARVWPWRLVTRIVLERHWYGDNVRIENESARLTLAGGYYDSVEALREFLESRRRYHARIEARVGQGSHVTQPHRLP
jgi:hypothetical protein